MGIKISQLTAKTGKLASTDLVEISEVSGATYVSKKVTGANLIEVSLDTSPQLGGNLDVNGNKITSASNGNISIEPNGTGAVIIGGNSTQATELRFMEDSDNGTNYVALKANDTLAANTTYTLPTADGTSGQVLSTNGTGTLSWATAGGGLTVGTTAVTSGTIGRIFFEGAGNVLQQDAAFFWDNTNKRLGVGATPSTSVRLDVRAQGALSTDIAFRVRNSADTQNLMSIAGDGRFLIGQNASNTCTGGVPQYAIAIGASAAVSGASETYGSPIAIGYDAQSVGSAALAIGNSTRPNTGIAIGHGVQSSAEGVAIGGSTTNARGTVIGSGSSNTGYGGSAIGYNVDNTGDNSFLIGDIHTNSIAQSFVWGRNGIKFWVNSNSNLVLANNKAITDANKSTYVNTSATNTITIHSGTAPTTSPADAFQQYSADITAGNAAPHFRTENGAIVKVYQETTAVGASTLVGGGGTTLTDTDTFDGYTLKQIVKALRNQGLLA